MDLATQNRRRALFTFFFIPGISMASWVTRTPDIRDALGATIAEMGLVLFGLSVGSMTGILSAGTLVSRLGTRSVARIGLLFIVAALLTVGLGVVISNSFVVAVGLMFFGLGMGTSEIAVNIDGADVERLTGTHLLHALHGFFSLGTVCGALLGIVFNAVNFSVVWHLGSIAVISLPLILTQAKHIANGPIVEVQEAASATSDGPPVWTDPRLYFIGLIVLGMALAEGAANDWLPLLMVDEYGFNSTSGSFIFLGFAAAMTIGRFSGGFFLNRFGRAAVMSGSAIIGAIGLGIVIVAHDPILAAIAVFMWGIGASLGFPVALSAAGDSGDRPEERVKIVAICGYIAFLVGPPMLGFVGETYSLRSAMVIVLGLVIVAAFAALSVRRPKVAAVV